MLRANQNVLSYPPGDESTLWTRKHEKVPAGTVTISSTASTVQVTVALLAGWASGAVTVSEYVSVHDAPRTVRAGSSSSRSFSGVNWWSDLRAPVTSKNSSRCRTIDVPVSCCQFTVDPLSVTLRIR